jgi:hypothetical protein
VFTVNGIVRPKIDIASGEKQFWRIVNASPDLYADLEVDSESMTVLAFDGMPLTYHDHTGIQKNFAMCCLPRPGGLKSSSRAQSGAEQHHCVACASILARMFPEPFSLCDSERIRVPRLNRMDDRTSHSEVVHRALCRHWNGATVITSTETSGLDLRVREGLNHG